MIRNGSIAYSNVPSALILWEPRDSYLNTLLIGILTTILSIQVASLVFDFLLGSKSSGQVKISNLHALLLVWSSSPMAILSNTSKNNWVARRLYGLDIPKNMKAEKNRMAVNWNVLAKLLVLFSIGPIVNIMAVAAVLETETSMTIQESGFGGLAWGVNVDLSVAKSYQTTESCRQYNISTVFQDEATVKFSSCNSAFITAPSNIDPDYGLVAVGVKHQSEMFVAVSMFGRTVTVSTIPQFFANGTRFYVKADLTKTNAAVLVERGIELISGMCRSGITQDAIEQDIPPSPPFEYIYAKKLPCNRRDPLSEEEADKFGIKVGATLRKYITFVKTARMDLRSADVPSGEEVSFINQTVVENIPFLSRRRRNLSVLMLVIICSAVIGIRISTILVLNNDTGVAVELVFKRAMGMGMYESLLQRGRGEVSYPEEVFPTEEWDNESG